VTPWSGPRRKPAGDCGARPRRWRRAGDPRDADEGKVSRSTSVTRRGRRPMGSGPAEVVPIRLDSELRGRAYGTPRRIMAGSWAWGGYWAVPASSHLSTRTSNKTRPPDEPYVSRTSQPSRSREAANSTNCMRTWDCFTPVRWGGPWATGCGPGSSGTREPTAPPTQDAEGHRDGRASDYIGQSASYIR
jgi:hypothetical protein